MGFAHAHELDNVRVRELLEDDSLLQKPTGLHLRRIRLCRHSAQGLDRHAARRHVWRPPQARMHGPKLALPEETLQFQLQQQRRRR